MSEADPARHATPGPGPSPSPLWLRLLGGLVLGLMGAGLLYAVAIGIANFDRIGV